ncbi:MAG: regulatory iron-sulfur-containing complex subunit RicT [Bacteroidota bacterium]
MGCGSCGSGGACSTGGCGKNGGCATGGCNKLNTYDWLGNMLAPDQSEVDNIYEVRFKNTRKGFYRNVNGLRLYIGDEVVVESDRGYDVGTLSLGGVMAELQMKKRKHKKKGDEIPRIFRRANEADLELLKEARAREQATLVRTREIVQELSLDMKLSDIEFQGDNSKAIFYYIADHRVDFRELIKVLAREFRIRVEMKQIGLRYEAGLLGGIGSCGRELCCSTWLTEFKTVSTSAARYQNLSLNPMKISGLCGRLKCCLNFELDVYLDAIQDFPKVDSIRTAKGKATLQKTDIFKGKMWFSYIGETTWYPLSVEEVKTVLAQNEKGEAPELELKLPESNGSKPGADKVFDFVDVVGTNIPKPEPKRRNNKKRKSRRGPQAEKGGTQQGQPRGEKKGPSKKTQEGQKSGKGKVGEGKNRPPRRQGGPRGKANAAKGAKGGPAANNQEGKKKDTPQKSGGPRNTRRGGGRRGPNRRPKKDSGQTPPAAKS